MKYSPQTGLFYGSRGRPMKPGKARYLRARVGKEFKYVHRLAFKFMGVDIPEGLTVDHINRDTKDNRWCNLRIVTHRQNMSNRRDSSVMVGIRKNGKKWIVRKDDRYLGTFICPVEAKAAYDLSL